MKAVTLRVLMQRLQHHYKKGGGTRKAELETCGPTHPMRPRSESEWRDFPAYSSPPHVVMGLKKWHRWATNDGHVVGRQL
eukprot:scaffold236112_cov19-Tisochrysis_lutea.AAC.1